MTDPTPVDEMIESLVQLCHVLARSPLPEHADEALLDLALAAELIIHLSVKINSLEQQIRGKGGIW